MNETDLSKLGSIQSLVQEELDLLERRLQAILHSDVPLAERICAYLNERPGKRIRLF